MYKHKQIGWTIIFSLAAGIIACGFFMALYESPAPRIIFYLLAVAVVLMYKLTVTVDNSILRAEFGPGFFGKTLEIKDMESCTVVRNRWWHGWGYHIFPTGRELMTIINVHGFDAVELKMKTGKIYRIGTDEPQELVNAIQSKIR